MPPIDAKEIQRRLQRGLESVKTVERIRRDIPDAPRSVPDEVRKMLQERTSLRSMLQNRSGEDITVSEETMAALNQRETWPGLPRQMVDVINTLHQRYKMQGRPSDRDVAELLAEGIVPDSQDTLDAERVQDLRLQSKQTRIDELQVLLSRREARIGELQEEVSSRDAKIEGLEARIKNLEEKAEEERQRYQDLEEQCSSRQNQIDDLGTQVQTLTAEQHALSTKCETLHADAAHHKRIVSALSACMSPHLHHATSLVGPEWLHFWRHFQDDNDMDLPSLLFLRPWEILDSSELEDSGSGMDGRQNCIALFLAITTGDTWRNTLPILRRLTEQMVEPDQPVPVSLIKYVLGTSSSWLGATTLDIRILLGMLQVCKALASRGVNIAATQEALALHIRQGHHWHGAEDTETVLNVVLDRHGPAGGGPVTVFRGPEAGYTLVNTAKRCVYMTDSFSLERRNDTSLHAVFTLTHGESISLPVPEDGAWWE